MLQREDLRAGGEQRGVRAGQVLLRAARRAQALAQRHSPYALHFSTLHCTRSAPSSIPLCTVLFTQTACERRRNGGHPPVDISYFAFVFRVAIGC